MIKIKTKSEIKKMKKAANILIKVKKVVYKFIKPGVTLLQIDKIIENEILKNNAKLNFKGYNGFPNASCISVNDALIHGIPNNYKIKNGDLVKVDLGCVWEGYHSDSAFTKGVGKISKQSQKVIDVAKKAFYKGFNAIKPGAKVGDISHAIGKYVKEMGMYVPKEFTGHGIGKELHEEPSIPNYGKKGTGELLKDGMVICIEPMIMQKSSKIQIMKDN
jgi:methionyl aminopeptidase